MSTHFRSTQDCVHSSAPSADRTTQEISWQTTTASAEPTTGEVPAVPIEDLHLPPAADGSAAVAARVAEARGIQAERYAAHPDARVNADASGALLDEVAGPDAEGRDLIRRAADRLGLSARGYHRILRTARTIADLAGEARVRTPHLAEAIGYRLPFMAGG